MYLPHRHFYFRSSSFVEFFERLPATLELIGASVIIALTLAGVCAAFSTPRTAWFGASLAAVLFLVVCIPAFWLALTAQLIFAVHGLNVGPLALHLPAAGMSRSDKPTPGDELLHLVLPATLLALFQAGAYVDSMRIGISPRRLLATFATLLPAMVSADLVVEVIFAWPGDGRALFYSIGQFGTSYILAFLISSAAIVIAVRAVARILQTPGAPAPEVLEPL